MNNTPRFTLCLGLLSLACSLPLFGQLTFERLEVTLKVGPDEDSLSIDFPFTVKGTDPVTITQYESACSCLSAEISENGKLVWKPGEKGVVKGNFKLGTLKGKSNKDIFLTIEGEAQPIRLRAKLEIPHLFVIEPPTLFWDLDGENKSQTFKVDVKHSSPIKITEITSLSEHFKYELKTLKQGWSYEVTVTPVNVKERAFGLLRIRNDSEFKKHSSAQAFMVIRTPPVKPSPKSAAKAK